MDQSHSKFKFFPVKNPGLSLQLGHVSKLISDFVATEKVAAKSIGVEYVEKHDALIVSLGYAEGQGTFPVLLNTVDLGKQLVSGSDLSVLETLFEDAASALSGVICHEFYVDKDDHVVAVFLRAST